MRAVDNRNLTQEATVEEELSYQELHRRFRAHHTIVLHGVENLHAGTRALAFGIEDFLQARVGVNLYFSPPASVGLPPHWDMTDVVILQVRVGLCWLCCGDTACRLAQLCSG